MKHFYELWITPDGVVSLFEENNISMRNLLEQDAVLEKKFAAKNWKEAKEIKNNFLEKYWYEI